MMMPRPLKISARRESPRPALKPAEPIKRTGAAAPVRRGRDNAIILLVDDDAGVLESLRRVFATEGFKVTAVSSGEEALKCIARQTPDLVITDLCMMTVSGWDLLYHEHFERPGVPFFVISALPPKSTGGADTFATEFFQKPLDLDALLAAVHRQLGTASIHPATNQEKEKP